MIVDKYMTQEVAAAPSSETISYIRNLMLKKDISRVIVIENSRPSGIVTKKDISTRLASESAPWRRRPIDTISLKRVMTRKLITVPSGTSIKKAAKLMIENNISSMPVLDKGSLVGIVTKMDLLRAYVQNYPGIFKTNELMSKNVITANRFHTITHLIDLMEEKKVGRLVIVDGAKPIGIVTSSDTSFVDLAEPKRGIRKKEVMYVRKPARGERPRYRYVKTFPLTAEDLMTSELVTIKSKTDVAKAAEIILENGISSLPVIEDDSLVGIISKTDIVRGIVQAER